MTSSTQHHTTREPGYSVPSALPRIVVDLPKRGPSLETDYKVALDAALDCRLVCLLTVANLMRYKGLTD